MPPARLVVEVLKIGRFIHKRFGTCSERRSIKNGFTTGNTEIMKSQILNRLELLPNTFSAAITGRGQHTLPKFYKCGERCHWNATIILIKLNRFRFGKLVHWNLKISQYSHFLFTSVWPDWVSNIFNTWLQTWAVATVDYLEDSMFSLKSVGCFIITHHNNIVDVSTRVHTYQNVKLKEFQETEWQWW